MTMTPTPYSKMDPKWKKKWLKALRTPADEGGYLQCRSALVKTKRVKGEMHDSFCCLGVLSNLVQPTLDQNVMWGGYLHPDVRDETGVKPPDQGTLVAMNDRGVSFKKIADWIEANL